MSQPLPRIALTGATGRTGNAVAHELARREDVQLAAVIAPSVATVPTRPLPQGVAAAPGLEDVLGSFDVLVDFTHADAAVANVRLALGAAAHVVLGTTGIDQAVLEELGQQAEQAGRGLLYAPNFAIGAVLMMRFAREASRYFADAEIVEAHHAGKRDAPSGTARHTAALVAGARGGTRSAGAGGTTAAHAPARGDVVEGIPVHSLRLAGAVAHQQVLLSGPGEVLTIAHDANDRGCYGAGVARAARGVTSFSGLRTGLEHVL